MKNREYFAEKKGMKKRIEEIRKNENPTIMVCEFCGKKIVRSTWNKKYYLINICQQPTKRFFCSSQCKLNWIFKLNKELLT